MSQHYSEYDIRFTDISYVTEWPSDETATEIFYRHYNRD